MAEQTTTKLVPVRDPNGRKIIIVNEFKDNEEEPLMREVVVEAKENKKLTEKPISPFPEIINELKY